MFQYYSMAEEIISNKYNQVRKVISFRKRVRYATDEILLATVRDTELLRVDSLAQRVLNSQLMIGKIIDANDKDVLSFDKNESIRFAL